MLLLLFLLLLVEYQLIDMLKYRFVPPTNPVDPNPNSIEAQQQQQKNNPNKCKLLIINEFHNILNASVGRGGKGEGL